MRAELGWSCANGDLLQLVCAALRRRAARTRFEWVKAHDGNEHNDAADRLAKAGAALPARADMPELRLRVPDVQDVTFPGLKVSTSLPPLRGSSQAADGLPAPELDLHNEPWFKLRDGSWSQDPLRWQERQRNAHRERAALAALRDSNLQRLVASHSRSEFWKIIQKWCGRGRPKITAEPDDVVGAFEARLHEPLPRPTTFDNDHRERMTKLVEVAADACGDTTPDGLFTRDITVPEVAGAKAGLKTRLNSAIGVDNFSYRDVLSIPNERLAAFLSRCIKEGLTPSVWNVTVLVAVPKSKGPYDNPENLRMIALECCILKLLTTIIDTRIRTYCEREGIIPPTQNGFRPEYCTENNPFILRAAVERAHADGKPLYTVFVDLRNAFPSVNRDLLWAKMIQNGICGPALAWIRRLYSDMRYRLRHHDMLSYEMWSDIGILMGDPGSPLAFLLYISDFKTSDHADDVELDGRHVSHLEHADDIVLFCKSEAGLQTKLDDLAVWASLNQMQVNTKKTVVMVFDRPHTRSQPRKPCLRLFDTELLVVDEQSYVGVTFCSATPNMWDRHLKQCERRARGAATRIFFVEGHTGPVPPWEGYLMYRAQVDPHLTWGCEVTGTGTLKQLECVEDVQLYYLRRLLGLQSRSQRCILFSETGIWPVRWRRLELQLRYLQHALSLPHSHLALAAARELAALDLSGRKGWSSKLREDVLALGLTLPPDPSVVDIGDVLRRLEKSVQLNLLKDIDASPKLELLRCRRDFSSGIPRRVPTIAFRSYLRLKNRELRVALTRLVLSDHSLAIERLRWRNGRDYDVPQDMRLCRFCAHAVEDTLHALFQCTGCDDLRALRRQLWLRLTRVKIPGHDLAALRSLAAADLLFCLLSFEPSTEILGLHAVRTLATYARTPMLIPTRAVVNARATIQP